jgi:predicted kinase
MQFQNNKGLQSRRPALILMCGLPASGKTTFGRELAKESGAIRFCPDEWKADLGVDFFNEEARTKLEARLWSLGQQFLKLGHSVILENGFWGRSERDELRQRAAELSVDTEIHFFDVPFKELMRRLEIRNESGGHGTVPLTRTHMEDYAKRFQAPDATELGLFTRATVHTPTHNKK